MRSYILSGLICLAAISSKVSSFSVYCGARAPASITQHSRTLSWRLFSSKEDEIRELEEKLQRLKEEAVEEEEKTVAVVEEEENVDLNEQAVYTELLTEQWKEDEAAAEEGGLLKSAGVALATIGLLVGLALFSQVPVGQEDLSRYSTPSAPSKQIDLGDLNRARQGGGDV